MKELREFLKNGIFFTCTLGLYYLFVFTSKESIPFPLDVSVLPTVLLALGMLSLLFTVIAAFYSLISVIVAVDPIDINYREIFYTKPRWLPSPWLSSIINFLFYFCLTPSLLFIAVLLDIEWSTAHTSTSLIVVAAAFSTYALVPRSGPPLQRAKILITARFWKTAVTFLYIGFFSLLSIWVFLEYIKFGLGIRSDLEYGATLLAFVCFSYVILIPPSKKNSFRITAEKHKKLKFYEEAIRLPGFFVYVFVVILSLIPTISYHTASASFNFLNIGGGTARSYYFSENNIKMVPSEIISRCTDDICITNELNIVLDIGGVTYVKGNFFGKPNSIISLPRQHLFPVISRTPPKSETPQTKEAEEPRGQALLKKTKGTGTA